MGHSTYRGGRFEGKGTRGDVTNVMDTIHSRGPWVLLRSVAVATVDKRERVLPDKTLPQTGRPTTLLPGGVWFGSVACGLRYLDAKVLGNDLGGA